MKRGVERRPLPPEIVVGARLHKYCRCGRKIGQFIVTRVGAGRKEAWAQRKGVANAWPHIVRASDLSATWIDHFKVMP